MYMYTINLMEDALILVGRKYRVQQGEKTHEYNAQVLPSTASLRLVSQR